jgi:HEAT repeat protein
MRTYNLLVAALLVVAAALPVRAQNEAAPAPTQPPLAVIQSASASRKEKADACRELARTGGKSAVAPLAKFLTDPDMSHMARYALETIPGSSVDKALRDALPKVDGRLLTGVIGSLGVRKDEKAVKPLTALLQYQDPLVAQAAGRALGSIGNTAAIKALEAALPTAQGDNKLAIAEGLLRAAEGLVARHKPDAAMKIYDLLRTQEFPHQVRTAALRGAAMTRGEGARGMLLEALRGDDFSQAAAAARIAQYLRSPQITLMLASELPKLNDDKQILVIQALAKRGDSAALPALTVAMGNSQEKRVRVEAIRAMAQIGNASIHPVLVDALDNSEREVARAAQEALASLQGPAVDKAVMSLINGSNNELRLIGMELASRRRMVSAVPALMKTSADSDAQVRVAAMRKLGELASTGDFGTLLDMLAAAKAAEDIEAMEQSLNAVCLRAANREQCVDQIAGRMEQAPAAQKAALLRLLTAAGGDKALAKVRETMKDTNPAVHSAALRALSGWSTVAAAPDLLEAARSSTNPTERMVALRGYLSLAKLPDVSEDKRLAMCRDVSPLVQKPEEKRLLLAALGDLNTVGAIETIEPFLTDDNTKEEAANAAVGIAERLLKSDKAAQVAEKLAGTLSKAASATANGDLAKRATKLAEDAKTKAEKK